MSGARRSFYFARLAEFQEELAARTHSDENPVMLLTKNEWPVLAVNLVYLLAFTVIALGHHVLHSENQAWRAEHPLHTGSV